MAETGRLTAAPATAGLSQITLVRIAIVVTVLVVWEATARSGLLFRDVVPSLLVIGRALLELLGDPTALRAGHRRSVFAGGRHRLRQDLAHAVQLQ